VVSTVTVTGFAFTFLVPVTCSTKVWTTGFLPVFTGSTRPSVTTPFEQAILAGSPLTAGFDERMQFVALDTTAESVTMPPLS